MEKTILEERKKTIYQFICDEFYVPMKAKEMAVVLSVPKSQRSELQEVLDALVMDGRIEVTSKGKYIKSEGKYLIGTFTAHARGFGFVSIEGEEEDIFIPESQVHGAFHMDTVQVAVTSENSGKRREGTITKLYPAVPHESYVLMKKVRRLDLPCRTILNSVQIFLFRRSVRKELSADIRSWSRSRTTAKREENRKGKWLRSLVISMIRGQTLCLS